MAEAPDQYIAFKDDIVLNGLNEVQIADLIDPDTDVIGLSLMFSGNWLHNRILIDHLGRRFPRAVIMARGEHLTAVPEFCIEQTEHLHVCICGEGEETVVDVVKAAEEGIGYAHIPGVVYRWYGRTAGTQFGQSPHQGCGRRGLARLGNFSRWISIRKTASYTG